MKRIMKDHESITKDYENFFYSMKDQCKKFFCIKSQAIHSNSSVLTESPLWHKIAAFKVSLKISHI